MPANQKKKTFVCVLKCRGAILLEFSERITHITWIKAEQCFLNILLNFYILSTIKKKKKKDFNNTAIDACFPSPCLFLSITSVTNKHLPVDQRHFSEDPPDHVQPLLVRGRRGLKEKRQTETSEEQDGH